MTDTVPVILGSTSNAPSRATTGGRDSKRTSVNGVGAYVYTTRVSTVPGSEGMAVVLCPATATTTASVHPEGMLVTNVGTGALGGDGGGAKVVTFVEFVSALTLHVRKSKHTHIPNMQLMYLLLFPS